jgi:alanine dehydrogenase
MMGRGILLGGIPGVDPGEVVVLGGGVVGAAAARAAAGLGARVTVLDIDLERLRHLADVLPANVTVLHSNPCEIRRKCVAADLVVGAVHRTGARAPAIVPREVLRMMKAGSVVVDVAVDQGGCVETTRPTTHSNPTFIEEGVVHYAVVNMPGAVGRTSTFGLANATLPYVRALADLGWREACRVDPGLASGVNVAAGRVTHPAVARAFGLPLTPVDEALANGDA